MSPNPIEGELRAAKGALIFIPDGTDRYLRVDVPLDLEKGFKSARARMCLVQRADSVVQTSAQRFKIDVQPEHGLPERVIGDVLDQDGAELHVDCGGFSLIVVAPEADPAYKGRIVCQMQGPLEARNVALL